jgi:hypothetical protein
MATVYSGDVARYPAFIGVKCRDPIPLAGGYPVDALIQASLDPEVTSIEFCEAVHWHGHALRLDGVVVTTRAGRSLLNIVGSLRDLDDLGTSLLALEEAGIGCIDVAISFFQAEPRRTDFRTVWHCRHVPVSDTTWRTISAELEGRSQWTLGDLLSRIDVTTPLESIYALACADRLCLDFTNGGLNLDMRVQARPGAVRSVEMPGPFGSLS